MDGDTPRYDITNTLVVGSDVDHNTMTSAVAKNAVRDWVLGGGTLIVFGSSEQVVQWLQPIFHSGIQSSSGAVTTPDLHHPVLHVSDSLSWEDYDNNGNAWSLQDNGQPDAPANLFTYVVKQGDDAVLAISDPGAYGRGTILLTSWLPHDLFGDGSEASLQQGTFLVNNLLMQGYRDLFLDYGPPLGGNIHAAVRNAQVVHPELGLVSLDFTLFVFSP